MIFHDDFRASGSVDHFRTQRYWLDDIGWQLVEDGVVVSPGPVGSPILDPITIPSIKFSRVAGTGLVCGPGDGVWFQDAGPAHAPDPDGVNVQGAPIPSVDDLVYAKVWVRLAAMARWNEVHPHDDGLSFGFHSAGRFPWDAATIVNFVANMSGPTFGHNTFFFGAAYQEYEPLGALEISITIDETGGRFDWSGDGEPASGTLLDASLRPSICAGTRPHFVAGGPYSPTGQFVVVEWGWEYRRREAGVAPGQVYAGRATGGIRTRGRILGSAAAHVALEPGSTIPGDGIPNAPNVLNTRPSDASARRAPGGIIRAR